MMRWPHTKHLSAVCWKPEYCGWDETQDLLHSAVNKESFYNQYMTLTSEIELAQVSVNPPLSTFSTKKTILKNISCICRYLWLQSCRIQIWQFFNIIIINIVIIIFIVTTSLNYVPSLSLSSLPHFSPLPPTSRGRWSTTLGQVLEGVFSPLKVFSLHSHQVYWKVSVIKYFRSLLLCNVLWDNALSLCCVTKTELSWSASGRFGLRVVYRGRCCAW